MLDIEYSVITSDVIKKFDCISAAVDRHLSHSKKCSFTDCIINKYIFYTLSGEINVIFMTKT